MVECYLQKIVEFITNKCPSSFIKIINLHLDVTRVNAGSVTKSTANLNHTFAFGFSHLKILSIDLYKNEQVGIFNNLGGLHPSLWNSSASPAEISCSSAVMRATISSTASGA